MEEKILYGIRKDINKNKLIGGHSPKISNNNPNYAVELKSINSNGTKEVSFTTQYADGKLSNIKNSTLFPNSWSDSQIIQSIKIIGNTPKYDFRASDGTSFHVGVIDGVKIKVTKIGPNVTSGYPTK